MVRMGSGDGVRRKSTRGRATQGIGFNNESVKITNGNNKRKINRKSTSADRKLDDRNNSRLCNSRSSTRNSLGKAVKRKSKISSAVLSDSSKTTLLINTNNDTQSKQKRKREVQEEQPHRKRIKKSDHNSCYGCEPVKRKSKKSCTVSLDHLNSVSSINRTISNNNNDKQSKQRRKRNIQEVQSQDKHTESSNRKSCSACREHVRNKSKNVCTVLSDSCKAAIAKNSNTLLKQSKRKKKINIQEELPQCKCTKKTNHCNCNACQGHQSTKPSAVKTKTTKVPPVVIEFPCKKSIYEKACNLRQIIESGELLPDSLRPLLNENVAKKYNANELAATIKEGRCEWQQVENRALKLVKLIRAELSIGKAYPEKCLPHLDELNCLNIDALMLKRNPILVNTVQVLCRYVGHIDNDITEEEKNKCIESRAQIRSKSENLFQKFRKLFNIEDGQPFMRLYKEKIQEYQETKNSKFLRELCQKVTRGFCKTNKQKQSKKTISENSNN